MTRSARIPVLAAYFVAFWVLLPALLWTVAARLDRAFGWATDPHDSGIAVVAAGAGLMAWAMTELWRRGRGLPVSALPPPRLARFGPYRHVRHPIYLGFNLVAFGGGLAIGSPALSWVVAPALLPAWIGYALLEERALQRRFGQAYCRYMRQVGLFPKFGLYRLSQLLITFQLIPVAVRGRSRVPSVGPVILVHNHASYLDPAFVGAITRRPVHFLTTAEAYRRGVKRWLVRRFVNVPVRRYRQDPAACREMLRLLAEGEVVADSAEGERTPDGRFRGALPEVARLLARIPVSVIPVGISGAYDTGPRWSDLVRRRPVSVRVGKPIRWDSGDPLTVLNESLRGVIDVDPQPVHLDGLPREKLERVLWRCPECGSEAAWRVSDLACGDCGTRFRPTEDGRLEDGRGNVRFLSDLSSAVRAAPEEAPLRARAIGLREASWFGAIRPLRRIGEGLLEVDRAEIRFERLRVSLGELRSTTTERADTVQVATGSDMWQFRLLEGSAFRVRLAVERWRAADPIGSRRRDAGVPGAPSKRLLDFFGRAARDGGWEASGGVTK